MIKTIRSMLARRKGRAIVQYVTALTQLSEAQLTSVLPHVMSLYRSVTFTAVELTERDPLPLLNLLDAFEKFAAHYTPVANVANEHLKAATHAAEKVITQHEPALVAAIHEITE